MEALLSRCSISIFESIKYPLRFSLEYLNLPISKKIMYLVTIKSCAYKLPSISTKYFIS